MNDHICCGLYFRVLRVTRGDQRGSRRMTTTESGSAAPASPVKSAVRTVLLLEHFAARPGLHSLADIQNDLALPKSSLYMLLRTLVNLGWVETDATGTRYGI